MHFLIDASLPRATAETVRSCNYEASDVRDINLGDAPDDMVAAHARQHGYCLLTRDGDFGNIQAYPPAEYNGLVVIKPPDPATRDVVLRLVEQLLRDSEVVENVGQHLTIVEPTRIRQRPA